MLHSVDAERVFVSHDVDYVIDLQRHVIALDFGRYVASVPIRFNGNDRADLVFGRRLRNGRQS
jgi:ABC-type branched-subunit amino acid transport system ATPase component